MSNVKYGGVDLTCFFVCFFPFFLVSISVCSKVGENIIFFVCPSVSHLFIMATQTSEQISQIWCVVRTHYVVVHIIRKLCPFELGFLKCITKTFFQSNSLHHAVNGGHIDFIYIISPLTLNLPLIQCAICEHAYFYHSWCFVAKW